MLIELIFKGILREVDYSFLKNMVKNSKQLYFNFPEISGQSFDEIMVIWRANDFVDLVINTDHLEIGNKVVPKVFINLERASDNVELLFYFDLRDLKEASSTSSVDLLRKWVIDFKHKYGFNYFICRSENGDKYYFDSDGVGDLPKIP